MKKLLSTTLFTFCFLLAHAQWMRATIEYHDGSKETGIGKIKGSRILYKANEHAAKQKLGSDKVKSVLLLEEVSEKDKARFKDLTMPVFGGAWKYSYVKVPPY